MTMSFFWVYRMLNHLVTLKTEHGLMVANILGIKSIFMQSREILTTPKQEKRAETIQATKIEGNQKK